MNHLFQAIFDGNSYVVNNLLDSGQGLDPNASDSVHGCNALMYAIYCNHIDIAKLIINDPRINLNARDMAGRTALMYAAVRMSDSLIESLVNRGADVKLQDANGANVLSYMISSPLNDCNLSFKILSHLLDNGADLNEPNTKGLTPFHFIIKIKHRAYFEYILNHYYDTLDNSPNAMLLSLLLAIKSESEFMVTCLLMKGVELNMQTKESVTPLKLAAHLKNERIVAALLAAGADPLFVAINGKTALEISLSHADFSNIIQQINKVGMTGLLKALSMINESLSLQYNSRYSDILTVLSNHYGCDNMGNSLLNYAIMNHYQSIISILIECSNMAQKNVHGYTPANIAVIHANTTASEIIYQHEGHLNQQGMHYIEPLSYPTKPEQKEETACPTSLISNPQLSPSCAPLLLQYQSGKENILTSDIIDLPPLFPGIQTVGSTYIYS